MKMRKLLSSFLLIISFASSAQTLSTGSLKISGLVVSELTGDPIPYCQITYQTNIGTRSDSSGNFQIIDLPSGVYKIYFQALDRGSNDTLVTIGNTDLLGLDWPVHTSCTEINQNCALFDISIGKLKLFLQSGDPPITYFSQKRFSKKYKVQFYEFGDLIQYPFDCLVMYNQAVFQHLDNKFGRHWRKDFRPNVPGYK
ncbi:carboxypeptidase regulatory-like domain-containing protein [Dyadobacter sp. UP-52]|uniref:Carboxypeptidase regulatory-like domain-containing protein n=2 Tax=Dyadobacter subterraneus TaxID=2773304 RepID=A0ABR9W956_9BACT|nr:carboxypeptidase regulatory-like domain-containing protein [Dyadobacter subterraneus]